MRVSVGGALLAVILCAATTGCASGVYGAAVTAQSPSAPRSQTTAGGYQFGGVYWYPALNSTLKLIKSPRRFGRSALLVAPSRLVYGMGATTVAVGRPTPGARYRVDVRLRGRSVTGSPLHIQLFALRPDNTKTKLNAASKPLRPGWHWYSLSGRMPDRSRIALRAVVSVTESLSPASWLAIGGIRARRISASGS